MNSDLIWPLVQTLSKAEKRQFVIEGLSGKRSGGYVELFRWYARQKSPATPGTDVLRKLNLTPNRLAVQKNYLTEKLNEFLGRTYTRPTNPAGVRQLLIQAEALYSRGLSSNAARVLKKARSLAAKNNQYVQQLDALEVFEANTLSYSQVAELQHISAEKLRLLPVIENMYRCQLFSHEILAIGAEIDYARSASQRRTMKHYARHEFLQNTAAAKSISASYYLLHARLHFTRTAQDIKANLKAVQEHMVLFDADKHMTASEINYYITIVFNAVIVFQLAGTTMQFQDQLQRWNRLCTEYAHALDEVSLMRYKFNNSELTMRLGLASGDTEAMLKELPRFRQLLKTDHHYSSVYAQSMRFFAAITHYTAGRYKQAHELLRENTNALKLSPQKYRFLLRNLLLQLMIHCDQQHDDVVEYLAKQLATHINRQRCTNFAEGLLPAFFERWQKTTPAKRAVLLREIYTQLTERYASQGDWQFGSNYQFFLAWLLKGGNGIAWSAALAKASANWKQLVRNAETV
jgi:cellobiose-specific phosphotransferase system component IIA